MYLTTGGLDAIAIFLQHIIKKEILVGKGEGKG